MSATDLYWYIPAILLSLWGFTLVPWLWRGELLGRDLISDEHGSAGVRIIPVSVPFVFGFLIGFGVLETARRGDDGAPAWLGIPFFLFVAAYGVLAAAIAAFNRPKCLVQPERRSERGLYS